MATEPGDPDLDEGGAPANEAQAPKEPQPTPTVQETAPTDDTPGPDASDEEWQRWADAHRADTIIVNAAAAGSTLLGSLTYMNDLLGNIPRNINALDVAVGRALGHEPITFQGQPVTQAVVFPEGEFSITDWEGYPPFAPKPPGPFRLLPKGAEYEAARDAANAINRDLHAANQSFSDMQIHENQPVKFGGDPEGLANKTVLPGALHSQITTWWRALQGYLEGSGWRISPP